MTRIPLTDEDIYVIKHESEPHPYCWHVKFLSLEGYDICWKKEQAEQLKKQILDDYEFYNAFQLGHWLELSRKEVMKIIEKADELDDLHDFWEATGFTHELQQENKQLKEIVQKVRERIKELESQKSHTKEEQDIIDISLYEFKEILGS